LKLAVVKPDHIGDLILSSPAIRAIAREYPDLTLMVASKSQALARCLFPGVELRTMDMPHLLKVDGQVDIPDLTAYDLVLFLRRDGVITPDWARVRTRDYILPEESHEHHQSILDYAVASEVVPDYEIDALFYGTRLDSVRAKALRPPAKIGFSIGSGFYTNAWPMVRWIETGRMLQAEGREIFIVGGPDEAPIAELLARRLRLSRTNLIIGGGDFDALFTQLDKLDLVIASDGGTAHLCSMSTPLLSLFGSSPINRYVPFGRWNRTISLRLPCSPCCQYALHEANGCLSVECMSEIDSEDVRAAMTYTLSARPRAHAIALDRGRTLFVGLSHLDQQRKLAERRMEADAWAV
jgi:ADP-heptose:LPS heptosyltransferase